MNLYSDIVRLAASGLLDKLLIDHTRGNIYLEDKPLTVNDLLKSPLLYRFQKRKLEQKERTKKKAEVFTPTWICKKMNDMLEEETNFKGSWEEYVSKTVLEICCGEAPFLVSRYDTVSGEVIPLSKRIGLLDRKLRLVKSETEDSEWIFKAFESTYGYEYSGDNLLIARINLLLTFEDYLGRVSSKKEYERIINIITWNLWQMDGLTNCLPGTDIPAIIYDWEKKESIKYKEVHI